MKRLMLILAGALLAIALAAGPTDARNVCDRQTGVCTLHPSATPTESAAPTPPETDTAP